ncbi:hypothetical protein [Microbacterium trichothecenolyticum]|uniref:Uncharacterized protein n=1 Tax=Microbacterium trichothecenolyticum TaxID=69370 RepID=A0ABU0TSY5_MICTR|nr:hypothetical protein [Microbacterium trichothecenolyticum]MDQ1122074.1 hypothetical protein [Microbacterium trichothecenolyticum]
MTSRSALSWLPAHQSQVLYGVAHIDGIVDALGLALEKYLQTEPLQIERRFTKTEELAVLVGVTPPPPASNRFFADALNAARNCLEHALYAEVVHRLGRPLTTQEARALEVPAVETPETFDAWARAKHRGSLGLLQVGEELRDRVHRLQPFHRTDPQAHPLQRLVAHTNHAKHREPAVALTRVGRVDKDSDLFRKPVEHRDVVSVGDVLASVPRGARELYSIWPDVVVQRPHTGEWITLMKEVGEIVDWVRKIALPILTMGRWDLPHIPPHLDITRTHESLDAAWKTAGLVPAAKRMQNRVAAQQLRQGMLELLVDAYGEPSRERFARWIDGLDDDAAMARFQPALERSGRSDGRTLALDLASWAHEAGVDDG